MQNPNCDDAGLGISCPGLFALFHYLQAAGGAQHPSKDKFHTKMGSLNLVMTPKMYKNSVREGLIH